MTETKPTIDLQGTDDPVCTTEHINHPDHYGGKDDPFEAIKVIEGWALGFHLGNTVKYIRRHGQKGGLEDLKKAQWYLDREIERVAGLQEDA